MKKYFVFTVITSLIFTISAFGHSEEQTHRKSHNINSEGETYSHYHEGFSTVQVTLQNERNVNNDIGISQYTLSSHSHEQVEEEPTPTPETPANTEPKLGDIMYVRVMNGQGEIVGCRPYKFSESGRWVRTFPNVARSNCVADEPNLPSTPAPKRTPAPKPTPNVPAPQTGGGGVTPPSATKQPPPGITVILPPVNTSGVPVIQSEPIPMSVGEPEVSEPVKKPKRKSLLPIPRDPDIPEMLPQQCRFFKTQPPKIEIVSVTLHKNPRRVHVKVRHFLKRNQSLHCFMLEFTDTDGKSIYHKEARSYKPGKNGMAWLRYKPHQYDKFGFSETEFILTTKWAIDKYDLREKYDVAFVLRFLLYSKRVTYYQPEKGHRLLLRANTDMDKDKMLDVVGQFPPDTSKEEVTPAAPSLIKPRMTTMWATLKK